jgi:hypothetical protein
MDMVIYSEGNNSDAFINNASQWSDTDGDGYGDNWGNLNVGIKPACSFGPDSLLKMLF